MKGESSTERSIVVYYSQTGNTKQIAEAIMSGIRIQTGQCDLADLRYVTATDLAKYDLIGIGCPVFLFREPLNVRQFVDSLGSLAGKHCFMFCTHGTILGGFFASLGSALKQQGLVPIGWYDSYANVSYQVNPTPWFTDGHPDDQDLAEAADFGKRIVARHQQIVAGDASLIPPFQMVPDRPFLTWPERPHGSIGITMTLNREKCSYPACRLCVDECPMGGIDLSVDPPVFRRDCISCYFCEKICPEGAIEVDWKVYERDPERLKKYRRAVDKATAAGQFRPLVDALSEPHYYKVHSKHPRYRLGG